jgi:polyhydroxybutyrate depolymerase
MLRFFVIALLAAAVVAVGPVGASSSPDAAARASDSYYVHRPANLPRTRQVPLVIGIGGRAMELQTGFSAAADRHGFVVAYVSPTKSYNEEAYRRGTGPPLPDMLYIKSVVERVRGDENIDPTRIYMTGGSQGGSMSYRFACDFPELVAAIGSVSGVDPVPACAPSGPVSAMEIHGTRDPYISMAQAQANADHWRGINKCPSNASSSVNGRITLWTWSPCRNKTAVALIRYEGGGHGWYAGAQLDATETVWSFFEAHPKTKALTAALRSVTVVTTAPRRVRVTLVTNEPASVTLTLRKGSRRIASTRAQVPAGTRALTLKVPRAVRPGSYTLAVTVAGDDETRVIKRTIRLKR